MAKKFGKIVLGAVAITASIAGVYYYLAQKSQSEEDFDDDDFDSFDENFDQDSSRNYTTLDEEVPASDSTSEETLESIIPTVGNSQSDACDNQLVKEADTIAQNANERIKEANHVIENFFDDENK